MIGIWILGALLLGLAVSRIGLPPLVGFLASGFVFAAFGMHSTPALHELAHAGVLLLLFAVGLKLRIKTLLRYEVWGTAISHLLLTGLIGVAVASLGGWLSPGLALSLAVSLGFWRAVLAAKVRDGNRELARAPADKNRMYIGDLYNAFLRRGAEPSGYNFWTGQLNSGAQTRTQVRTAYVNSPEFQTRVNNVAAQTCIP